MEEEKKTDEVVDVETGKVELVGISPRAVEKSPRKPEVEEKLKHLSANIAQLKAAQPEERPSESVSAKPSSSKNNPLQKFIYDNPVLMFSKSTCPFCFGLILTSLHHSSSFMLLLY